MNRKKSLFLLSFAACLLASGLDYRTVPHKDKAMHPDLTFCVTFDQFSAKAEKAKGAPDSTTLSTLNLGLRGTVGFDKGQGYQPIGDEELLYSVPNNISVESGTVTLWVSALDYNPGTKDTAGKKRGNIAIFELMAKNEKTSLDFKLYEYADTLYFGVFKGQYAKQVSAPRNLIKQNQWHQVAVTWDKYKISIYLNGAFCEEMPLSIDLSETMKDFLVDPKLSYFGIPHTVWGEKRKYNIQIDDLKIYSRALSQLEIKKQYRELALDSQTSKIDLFEIKLNGVGDAPDALELDLDFSALPEKDANSLKQGKLKIDYTLTGPDGFMKNGTWDFTGTTESRRISGIEKPGTYAVTCNIVGNERSDAVSAKIYRPDLSFIGNKIGYSSKVPAPWTPLVMKDRTVSVWNRVYTFGDGPFPESIVAAGKKLLQHPPELKISLPSGPVKITYSAGKTDFTEREATLRGRGAFDKYYFDYTTLVAYDGLIKTNFVIHGCPEIASMTIAWQVSPASAQYLMTPLLNEDKNDQFTAPYPKISWEKPTMLWFTSERNGGFAYAMENDANWSYPEDSAVLMANKKTGECSVTMISKEVKLPEATDYQALFIATPTRPLVDLRRNVHFGPEDINQSYNYPPGTGRPLLFTCGRGLADGISSYKPLPGLFEKEVGTTRAFGIYGMANSLTTKSPIVNYLAKYYDIPGAYKYTFPTYEYNEGAKKYDLKTTFSVPACNAATSVNDYILHNIQEIMDNPCGDRLWMIYYDLADNTLCGNKLHGCAFTDKLGREIKTMTFMKKRGLFERSVQLAHDHGKVVLVHAQRDFSPFMHGLADYWYPGEQNNGLTIKNLNCYTDDIPDAIWRSEYNSNVLGVSVIFLPAELFPDGTTNPQRENVAKSMVSQCILHDIEFSMGGPKYSPIVSKAWAVLEKYGVYSYTPFHRYYEQSKVVSANPDVRISYYEMPGQQYLFVLANKTAKDAETEVDFSKLGIANGKMREEFVGGDLVLHNGKINITVPSRSFRLVGYPVKQFYPYVDAAVKLWNHWKNDKAKVEFKLDPQVRHNAHGSFRLDIAADNPASPAGDGCYTLSIPAVPGKTYVASAWAKAASCPAGARVELAFQGQTATASLGLPPIAATIPAASEWNRISLVFQVPTTGEWTKCTKLLLTLSAKNAKGGTVWFDDLAIEER